MHKLMSQIIANCGPQPRVFALTHQRSLQKSWNTARWGAKLVVRYTHTQAFVVLPHPGANSATGASSTSSAAGLTAMRRFSAPQERGRGFSKLPVFLTGISAAMPEAWRLAGLGDRCIGDAGLQVIDSLAEIG